MIIHLTTAVDKRIIGVKRQMDAHSFFYRGPGSTGHEQWLKKQDQLQQKLRDLMDLWYSVQRKPLKSSSKSSMTSLTGSTTKPS